MHHLAANYIFDGENFLKNTFISINDNNLICAIGKENELSEKPRMIFYNGIICPCFLVENENVFSIEFQKRILENIKKEYFMYQSDLKSLLKKYTKEIADNLGINNYGQIKLNINPGLILLENINLSELKIKDNTSVIELNLSNKIKAFIMRNQHYFCS